MNIFFRELKANVKSLLIWSGIIGLLILMSAAKFSGFAGDPEMVKMLDSLPPAMMDAFNMRGFNLTTIAGWRTGQHSSTFTFKLFSYFSRQLHFNELV